MPLAIFLEGLKIFSRLDKLHNWAKSLSWLPQKNKHFTDETAATELGAVMVNRPGFSNMPLEQPLISFIKQSAKKMK